MHWADIYSKANNGPTGQDGRAGQCDGQCGGVLMNIRPSICELLAPLVPRHVHVHVGCFVVGTSDGELELRVSTGCGGLRLLPNKTEGATLIVIVQL